MIFGQFGEARVPFERPVQASPGFMPRSLDTGFVAPENNPFPQIMAARLLRAPTGVHQPLTAEPGVLPQTAATAAAAAAPQAPSGEAIKKRGMRMLPPPLLMRLGIFPGPRAVGIRAGLDPSRFVAGGRKPGL